MFSGHIKDLGGPHVARGSDVDQAWYRGRIESKEDKYFLRVVGWSCHHKKKKELSPTYASSSSLLWHNSHKDTVSLTCFVLEKTVRSKNDNFGMGT